MKVVAVVLTVLSAAPFLGAQSVAKPLPMTRASDSSGPSVPQGWLARVSESIQREEYRFSSVERDVWSAPNRAHGLRSRVGRSGLEVFPRETDASGEGAAWTLQLATIRFGRAGDSWPLECRSISVEGERAELDHGCLLEWFENSA